MTETTVKFDKPKINLDIYSFDKDLEGDGVVIEKQHTTMSNIDFWKYVYSAFLAAVLAHFVVKIIEWALKKSVKEIALIVDE